MFDQASASPGVWVSRSQKTPLLAHYLRQWQPAIYQLPTQVSVVVTPWTAKHHRFFRPWRMAEDFPQVVMTITVNCKSCRAVRLKLEC
ncbi:unnamed protein product [Macrosiphum euphorbiae]|uniref:Uncharacterized protein n=1 Tax=Macrosiphum euphorbiae TaxID=13131 RepID=A0AAV0VYE4_9HEMI|nr:unnamed protein product [Macrosiphum euphorbiae]